MDFLKVLLICLLSVFTSRIAFAQNLQLPQFWEYTAPLISPAESDGYIRKDPSVVFDDGRWHVFVTIKLPGRSAIEHISFTDWEKANQAKRTILTVSDSDYFCAPQVFYFRPHRKWYLIYQNGVEGLNKMQVAFSTTTNLNDPDSWTQTQPILDGGPDDPRKKGGLDYWIICDEEKAYLFFTTLNGKMWRVWTDKEKFPSGFRDCEVALDANIFEAAHIYRLKDQNQYLALIEKNGQRHYKAYLADHLDGNWSPLADSFETPFAGAKNIRPGYDVAPWTDNISHGELIRVSSDETLTVDPADLRFIFQGMLEKDKRDVNYGKLGWRIGMLKPVF